MIGKRNRRSNRIAYCTWRANAKPSSSSLTASLNAVRSQRNSSSEYIQYGIRWRIMNGSNGRSPWLCARSWIRSHSSNASRESGSLSSKGGRVGREIEPQRPDGARRRRPEAGGLAVAEDAAEVVTGVPATLTVSGNRTAHSLS